MLAPDAFVTGCFLMILGAALGAVAELAARYLPQMVDLYGELNWEPDEISRELSMRGPDDFPWGSRGLTLMATGAVGGMACALQGGGLNQITLCLFFILAVSLTITTIDLDHQWVPDFLSIPLLLAGLLISPFAESDYDRILGLSVGMAVMWLAMLLSSRIKGADGMSGGDIILAGAAGAWLGANGLADFWLILGGAFVGHMISIKLRRPEAEWAPAAPSLMVAMFLACLFSVPEVPYWA